MAIGSYGKVIKDSSFSSKLRYVDMNASSGGVARDTVVSDASWVDIFSYAGSGLFLSFLANLETGADWSIRLLIDGTEEIFGSSGLNLNDVAGDGLYDLDPSGKNTTELAETIGFFLGSHDRFVYGSRLPIGYTTSVAVKVKRNSGAATKKFKAGLAILTKET